MTVSGFLRDGDPASGPGRRVGSAPRNRGTTSAAFLRFAALGVLRDTAPTENRNSGGVGENVLRDLRNFSVENATPLECLLFVSSLKKQLNNGDLR